MIQFSSPPVIRYTCVRSTAAQSCSCSTLNNPFSISSCAVSCHGLSFAKLLRIYDASLTCRSRRLQDLLSILVSLVTHARRCCLHICLVVMSFCSVARGVQRGCSQTVVSASFVVTLTDTVIVFPSMVQPYILYGPSKTADGPSKYLRDLLP